MKYTIYFCGNPNHVFNNFGWWGTDLPDNVDEDEVASEFFYNGFSCDYLQSVWDRIIKKYGPELKKRGIDWEYRSAYWDWNGGDYCGRILDYSGGNYVKYFTDQIEEIFFETVKNDQKEWWTENKKLYLTEML